MSEVSKTSDKMARSVLWHLSKDTKGPWIQLPQELAAGHSVLGRNSFITPDVPWQIRSAQIGYRSKIIRRPPPVLLREALVLIMSLGDKTFRVFKDWTECSKCTGQPLGPEAYSARMFLFVLATKDLPVHHDHVVSERGVAASASDCPNHALMVSCVEEGSNPPCMQHLSQICRCQQCTGHAHGPQDDHGRRQGHDQPGLSMWECRTW